MATELIEIENGFLVEVQSDDDGFQQVVASDLSGKVQEGLAGSKVIISETINNFVEVWGEVSDKVTVDSAEIELGLGFAAKGKLFIVQGDAKANLKIKIKIKEKP